jgi:hypothetical protein
MEFLFEVQKIQGIYNSGMFPSSGNHSPILECRILDSWAMKLESLKNDAAVGKVGAKLKEGAWGMTRILLYPLIRILDLRNVDVINFSFRLGCFLSEWSQ